MKALNWLRAAGRLLFLECRRLKRRRTRLSERVRFLGEYLAAARQIAASGRDERLRMNPRLGERTPTTGFDANYFYQDAWAFRHIVERRPALHVDVGSRVIFVGLLSCTVPVEFVDVRPLQAKLPNLICRAGSLLALPYADASVESLSCLHVAEHVGLGRYGEDLDVLDGTRRACAELSRVLMPGGRLYFGLPVAGEDRIEFNAHRVHTAERVLSYFEGLDLLELSGVTDAGEFVQNVDAELLGRQRYGCGLFVFTRKEGRDAAAGAGESRT